MFIILVLLLILSIGTSIWAIVDAASQPPEAFVAIGSSKNTWITLIAVFTVFFALVGFVLALVYFFSVRPKLNSGIRRTLTSSSPMISRRSWVSFLAWVLVGSAFAMVFLGAFTIGIFFLPVAIIATVLLTRRPLSRRGLPGLLGGIGLPLFYVAYLNRDGPGMVCTQTRNAFGVGQSCSQEWSPWLWLSAGMLLFIASVVVFMVTWRSSEDQHCSQCTMLINPGANFCTHCGSRCEEFNSPITD